MINPYSAKRPRERYAALAAHALPLGLILLFFFWSTELFFTHDSFHYMHLSLFPVAGDSHPLLYGFFLRMLSDIGTALHINLFGLWATWISQSALAALSVLYLFRQASGMPIASWGQAFRKITAACVLLLLTISLYILKSAAWTETIFIFGLVCLFSRVRSFLLSYSTCTVKEYTKNALIIFLMCGILYHLRYQAVVMFVSCLITLAFGLGTRGLRERAAKIAAFILCVFVYTTFIRIPDYTLPRKGWVDSVKSSGAKTSYLCFWRCKSSLISDSDACHANSKLVSTYSCSDILIGVKKLPLNPSQFTFSDLIYKDGWARVATWAALSPIQWLLDQHRSWGLEIGRFRYQDDDAVSFYKEAGDYFRDQFNRDKPDKSSLYQKVEDMIYSLHFKFKVFNISAAMLLLLSLFYMWCSRCSKFYLFALLNLWGTMYVFSTFNPHTPWRFLVQLNLLGLMTLLSAVEGGISPTSRQPCETSEPVTPPC